MRKLILVVVMFITFACTLGQTPPNQSAAAPASAPTESNTFNTSQPTATEVVESGPTNGAALQAGPRRPRGIYAVVNIYESFTNEKNANPFITPPELEAYLVNLYKDLLGNPAVSGLAIWESWSIFNPNPPTAANAYDWSYLDDAFNQASTWNSQNPAKAPKTIQLFVTPGFGTPQWVMNQIPSCDGLFMSPPQTPPNNCGKATFSGFVEGGGTRELPMPWDPIYKSSWRTFLTALATRYGSNPAFGAIAVAGPTASSEEIMLPINDLTTNPQTEFGVDIAPNDMWLKLLAFHYPGMAAYQKSDQAFIDEWNAAINMYGEIFSGVTLIASTGTGLPNLSPTGFMVPSAFKEDCLDPDMDCAAESTILAHFAEPTVGGPNAKATQEDGMEASRVGGGNLKVGWLSQSTAHFTSPSAQILGGLQFNSSFAQFPLQEGCSSKFPPDSSDAPTACNIPSSCTVPRCMPVACIPQACLAPGVTQANLAGFGIFSQVPGKDLMPPEQAEYNVLKQFFNDTAAASSFGGTQGTVPFNYLQIYSEDIQYATAHVNAPAQVVQANGTTVTMTAQDLLNLASQKLLEISEPKQAP